jgi:hypothetical protein
MFGQVWNHGTLRKYVIYFGTLFNEVILTRDDAQGNQVAYMKVPLNYGPKEKYLARLDGNPTLERPIAITLPRMAFEMMDIRYAADRKLTTTGKLRTTGTTPDSAKYQYNPVPYDMIFNLYIMVKNAEDGTRIVEQILPFFAPEWTATLNINPDLGVKYDVPVVLNSVKSEDTYEGSFETRRALIWTLQFTMRGYLFGPTKESKIIKQSEINLIVPNGQTIAEGIANTSLLNTVEITAIPGLTANGNPTSNAAASIDKSDILSTDDYGFIIDIQENY